MLGISCAQVTLYGTFQAGVTLIIRIYPGMMDATIGPEAIFPYTRKIPSSPSWSNHFRTCSILIEKNAFLSVLFWRPAIYLYLSIIVALIFYLKTRIGRVFLILAPIFGQSAFLFFFNRTQNFRYQYCAVSIALIILGLLFIPKLSSLKKVGKDNKA